MEAARAGVRYDPDWRRQLLRMAIRRDRRIAKLAMGRKLAVRLYWMWRKGWIYQQLRKFGSHAELPVADNGVR